MIDKLARLNPSLHLGDEVIVNVADTGHMADSFLARNGTKGIITDIDPNVRCPYTVVMHNDGAKVVFFKSELTLIPECGGPGGP